MDFPLQISVPLTARTIFLFSLICISFLQLTVAKYRVIHKSLRDFRPLRYSTRGGQAEGEHVNGGRDTPYFCPNLLQALDMSTLGDAADVKFLIKFLPHTCFARVWQEFD